MEVHSHTHTPRKKFTHYLWEFLMLFLAVFAGFLAENQREHYVEHQRAKEYAQTLYTELYGDSIVVASKLKIRLEKEKDMDYLDSYFRDSSLTNLPREFYPAYIKVMYLINTYAFEPRDGILSQLRNSGSLRYFKNISLQKLLGEITVNINNVRARNDQEYQYFANPIKLFILRHLDFGWINELRKQGPDENILDLINKYISSHSTIEGRILIVSDLNREEVSNMILFYKQMIVSTRTLQYNDYVITNHKILQVLRDGYPVKNE